MRPLTFDQAWIKDGRRLSGAAVVPRKPASCDSNDVDDAPAYMKFLEDTPRTKQTTALQSHNSSLLCQAENDGARRTPARTASKHLARHLTHKDALLNYADQRQSAISELRRTHSNSSSSTSSSTAPYNNPSCSTAAKSRKQAATSNRTPTAAPKAASLTRTSSQPVWSSSDDDSDLGDNVTTAAARRRRDRVSAMYDKMTTTTPHSTMTFGRLRQQTPSEAAASSTTSTSISTSSTISARVAAAAATLSSTSTSSIGTSVISPSLSRSPPSVTLMHRYSDGDDGIEPDACPCEACAARIAVRRSATYQALAAGPPASQLRSAIGPASSRSSGGAHRIRTPVVVHPTSHTPRMSSSSRQYQKRQQEEDERRLQHMEGSGSEAADRYPSAAALLSLSSGGSSRRNLQETRDGDEDRRRHMYELPYHQRRKSPRDYRELLFGAVGGLKGGLKHVAATPMSHSRQQKAPVGGSRMVDFFLSEGGAAAAAVAEARCSSRLAAATAARRRTAVDCDVGPDFDLEEATLRPDYVSPANPRHGRRGVWELAAAAAGGPKGHTMSNMDGAGGRGSRHGRQETDIASETVVLMSDSSEDELVRRVASFARRGGGDGGGPALGPPRGRIARDQWAAEAATAAAAAAARVASRVRRTLAGTPGSLSRRMLQTDLLRPGASRSSSSVASTSKRSVSSARSTCSNRSGGSGGSRRSGGSVSHRGERQHLGDGAGRWLMTEALRSPGYGDGYDGPHDGSSDGAGGGGRVGATRSPSQRLPLSAVWGGAGGGASGGGRRSSGRPPRSPPSATGDSAASAAALKRWMERYGNRTAGAGSSYGSQRRVDGVASSRRVLQF